VTRGDWRRRARCPRGTRSPRETPRERTPTPSPWSLAHGSGPRAGVAPAAVPAAIRSRAPGDWATQTEGTAASTSRASRRSRRRPAASSPRYRAPRQWPPTARRRRSPCFGSGAPPIPRQSACSRQRPRPPRHALQDEMPECAQSSASPILAAVRAAPGRNVTRSAAVHDEGRLERRVAVCPPRSARRDCAVPGVSRGMQPRGRP
jgi:hypothetical protein